MYVISKNQFAFRVQLYIVTRILFGEETRKY